MLREDQRCASVQLNRQRTHIKSRPGDRDDLSRAHSAIMSLDHRSQLHYALEKLAYSRQNLAQRLVSSSVESRSTIRLRKVEALVVLELVLGNQLRAKHCRE